MRLLDFFHGRLVHVPRVLVLRDHIAPLLPQGAVVLDVGSGDGLVGQELVRVRPDLEVRGVDVGVRPNAAIPTERFDGIHIPYPDGAVDVVMFVDVLHHTSDPGVLLAEASRVARRAVVIKDHLREGVLAGARLRFMDWVGNARHHVSLPYNYWTRQRWSDAFARLGLEVSSWQGKLGLYPRPFHLVFEQSLHFIARLDVPERNGPRARP